MTLYSSVRCFLTVVCSSSSSSSASFCLLLETFSILSWIVIVFFYLFLLLEGAGVAGIAWQSVAGSSGWQLKKEFCELRVLSLNCSDSSASRAFLDT